VACIWRAARRGTARAAIARDTLSIAADDGVYRDHSSQGQSFVVAVLQILFSVGASPMWGKSVQKQNSCSILGF